MESTHKRSVTTRAAARKGGAAGRILFGKGLFHLAAASPAKTKLREHSWSKPVGDPCVHAVFQEAAWFQHLENLCGTCWIARTNLSTYPRLSRIPQCFQAPSTQYASPGYSMRRTCVTIILWQWERFWSRTSCYCRSSHCWISVTKTFSFELWVAVGLQLENRIVQIKSWTFFKNVDV